MFNFQAILFHVFFFNPSSSLGEWGWGGENFFYNSRNTYGMEIKLCPREPYLVVNILKLKEPHQVTCKYAQRFHI